MNKTLNKIINERMNKRMDEWMKEIMNERMYGLSELWIVNYELQGYGNIKQRYYNGLIDIHTSILEIVNIYTAI